MDSDMITMREFMELVDYKITEGSSYLWNCYGHNAYCLDSWNGVHGKGGYSFSIVFSTKTQKVYEVSVCDYTNDRAYRMINPNYIKKFNKENVIRGLDRNCAWDDIKFIDLETVDDFIQKALAIKAGESYDTRVELPLELDDETSFKLMKMAHERDITFNQMVEILLQGVIDDHKGKL
jgi:hypothetical protein